ncbi:hypothetical protein L2K70_12775 [Nocardioides KLBMP 9356]|uniref:Uncharacterized protein n=1 Tax=Nocardioides potassii TaxID=2911371 RepID=A0ABS9HDR3_9ACTN|nr:hypothetical protein [Nocardioides potassii]MCF6378478.1 hypothetical protein [Nocardioides potassii]
MRLRLMARTAVIGGLAVASILTPLAAGAASDMKADRRGDGMSGVDFRTLRIDNGTERATMALTVADLPKSGVVFLSFVDPYDGEYGGGVQVRRAKGVVTVRFYDETYEGMKTVPCPGTRGTWSTERNRVTATFAWSCSKYGPYDSNHFYAQWGRVYDRSDHFGSLEVARG